MLGNHCIKTYSQTEETIALSSGESEFYGIVKTATMGLGMKGLLEDIRIEVGIQVNTDSSAAKSMAMRKGAGRVRHIEVRELWVQDRVAKGELQIFKVKGEFNVADGLTKHVERHNNGQIYGSLWICAKRWSPWTLSCSCKLKQKCCLKASWPQVKESWCQGGLSSLRLC